MLTLCLKFACLHQQKDYFMEKSKELEERVSDLEKQNDEVGL